MLKDNKNTLILASVVTVLPILVGVLLWKRLPDAMATHFGINNEANGYSSKLFAVFGLPLFLLAAEWITAFVTAHDPRKQNISPKLFALVLWIIPICSIICAAGIYPSNLGIRLDTSLFAGLFVGVLYTVIGSILPKVRQNYTIGIKTPWALDNEENWNRTHRLSGRLLTAGGILITLGSLTGILRGGWLMGVIFAIASVPFPYSLWLHVKRGL